MSDIMARVKENPTKLWIPGAGDVPLDVIAVQNAIREHDDQLYLARHNITGDWCVYIQGHAGREPLPVIALASAGEPLPSAEEVRQRLYMADTRIHGSEILSRMHRKNEELKKQQAQPAEDATEAAAEAYAWAHKDIKGYSGRVANVKGTKRDFKPKEAK